MGLLNEMTENYTNCILGRAIVTTIIPGGSAIDMAITQKWSNYQQERWEELLNNFKLELKRVDSSKIDRVFVESEEFHDIIKKIVFDSLMNGMPEKRVAYPRAVVDYLENPTHIFNLEDAINSISNIKERELRYIKRISELVRVKPKFQADDFIGKIGDIVYSVEDTNKHLYRLANYDIIDYSRNTLSINPVFYITPLGEKLMKYLGL